MNKNTKKKLKILLLILLIIALLYILYRNIEGHTVEAGHEHTPHGSCDCNPNWVSRESGFGSKCHSKAPSVSIPLPGGREELKVFDLDTWSRRGDVVKDFCEGKEYLSDCNNAEFPGEAEAHRTGGAGACLWTGEDAQYEEHQGSQLLICGDRPNRSHIYCQISTTTADEDIRKNTEIIYSDVPFPTQLRNKSDITRNQIIDSDEFRTWLGDKELEEFTGSASVSGFTDRNDLTGSSVNMRGGNKYFSVLVTGSSDPTDIGKIYKSSCYSQDGTAMDTVTVPPREVNILSRNTNCANNTQEGNFYDTIMNTEAVVSLGNEDNENNKYGIVLNW